MENSNINLIVLRTPNIAIMLQFYQQLGLTFVQEQHGNGPLHYSCNLGNIVLELYPNKGTILSTVGFAVNSLEQTIQILKEQGIEAKYNASDPNNKFAIIKDPDGRSIYLSQK